jgi:hypothetical protein
LIDQSIEQCGGSIIAAIVDEDDFVIESRREPAALSGKALISSWQHFLFVIRW